MELNEKQLAAAIGAAVREALRDTKEAVGTPGGFTGHGPNGLFQYLDAEHPVLSAMVQPTGLLGVLPITRADAHTWEHMTTITGVTGDASATEPEGVCDPCIQPGLTKVCDLAAPFGRVCRETRELSVFDLNNRRDAFEDLSFMASSPVTLMEGDNWFPMGGIGVSGDDVIRTEWGKRLFELATSMQRVLCEMVWTGNPANNTAAEGYMEFAGLDLWINTGTHIDSRTSAVCHALDSDIKPFGFNKVDGVSPDIVDIIHEAWEYISFNARRMGLWPATWVIAMTPDLFKELVKVWPCRYMSNRCTDAEGANIVVVNDMANQNLRNEMQGGSYLLIGNQRIPVIQDMCIPEDNWITNENCEEGEYASDIYFIPMTAKGMIVTAFQYRDEAERIRRNALTRELRNWATDSGMFLWNATRAGGNCFRMAAAVEPRLLMHTPQLAARITDVKYAPLQHMRSHDPDALYNANGGVTKYVTPASYMWGVS
jgi:hypothetical protein